MALSAKPTGYTVNTGHAKCPDHLYMLDDSTGGTTVADGVGTLDLTTDSTGMWNTDGTYGQILRFVSASSQKALSGNTFAATSGVCLVAAVKSASATNPVADQYVVGLGHNSTSGIYGGVTFDTAGRANGLMDTGGTTNITRDSGDDYDGTWHLIAVKSNDTTGTDGVVSISIDGGAWTSTVISGTGDQDLAQFVRVSLGCRPSSTPSAFFDGDILAAFVYVDDYSAWDDAWVASIYADPWQFLSTAVKYVKVLAESSAASESSLEVVVHSAPSGSNYVTGTTRYGSTNGQAFEATLEAGEAVLLVPAADVGCSSLAASTAVAALAQNATYTTGMVAATIVEV